MKLENIENSLSECSTLVELIFFFNKSNNNVSGLIISMGGFMWDYDKNKFTQSEEYHNQRLVVDLTNTSYTIEEGYRIFHDNIQIQIDEDLTIFYKIKDTFYPLILKKT